MSSVGVVVPVYNAEAFLPWSVPTILAQRGVSQWVFVDDGSADSSAAALDRLLVEEPTASLLRLADNRGRAAARNAGVDACGPVDVIVFFDSDVAPPPDTVEAFLAALSSSGVVASVAQIRHVDPPEGLYGAYVRQSDRGVGTTRTGEVVPWRYFVTAASAVERSAFEQVGGFDPDVQYGEDLALAIRLADTFGNKALRAAGVTVPMRDTSTLERALGDVAQFGRDLHGLASRFPSSFDIAGLPSWLPSASRFYPGRLARSISSFLGHVGGHLPDRIQARIARLLLADALLQGFHEGARSRREG